MYSIRLILRIVLRTLKAIVLLYPFHRGVFMRARESEGEDVVLITNQNHLRLAVDIGAVAGGYGILTLVGAFSMDFENRKGDRIRGFQSQQSQSEHKTSARLQEFAARSASFRTVVVTHRAILPNIRKRCSGQRRKEPQHHAGNGRRPQAVPAAQIAIFGPLLGLQQQLSVDNQEDKQAHFGPKTLRIKVSVEVSEKLEEAADGQKDQTADHDAMCSMKHFDVRQPRIRVLPECDQRQTIGSNGAAAPQQESPDVEKINNGSQDAVIRIERRPRLNGINQKIVHVSGARTTSEDS
jgi:hypothetical protein